MRKKLITGAAVLALLMNVPQVSAEDDIVIFGGEFEDEAAPAPKKVETPKPKPPEEKPVEKNLPPEVVEPQDKPPAQSEQPIIEEPQIETPIIEEPVQIEPPIIEEPVQSDQPIIEEPAQIDQPIIEEPPIEQKIIEEPAPIVEQPFEQPTNISGGQERVGEPEIIIPPQPEPIIEQKPVQSRFSSSTQSQPQQELKTLKPRFIKLAVDDTYTYYLDKTSVQWKRIPYLANEYMADVWIRMIERDPAPLDDNMTNYGADNFRAEIALAREQGYQYPPEDLKVLRSQAYVLEHYYIRPKTHQIQFLCELEVFGRPQNAINERAYDNKNWENLVPGSVESAIYDATIKVIGKSKATGRGHMNFFDMLDEYGRIALN